MDPSQARHFRTPEARLWPKLLLVSMAAFGLGIPGMALVADLPEIKLHERVPSSMPGEPELVAPEGSSAWEKADFLFEHYPQVCREGRIHNELQRERCEKLWLKSLVVFGLASFPFILALIAWFVARDHIRFFYRATRKRILRFPPESKGRITSAALGPDAFSWYYCLRKVWVELPEGQHREIYVPLEIPIPRAGEVFTLFDAGSFFGKKRWVGVLYAPHMAIRSGSR